MPNKPPRVSHDRLLKTFFLEFVELFFLQVAASGWSFWTDVTRGERHEADLVVKAAFKVFLVHLEPQSAPPTPFFTSNVWLLRALARAARSAGLPHRRIFPRIPEEGANDLLRGISRRRGAAIHLRGHRVETSVVALLSAHTQSSGECSHGAHEDRQARTPAGKTGVPAPAGHAKAEPGENATHLRFCGHLL